MRLAIIIPARYASTRLPGKPLLKSTGKYLVQHVYEQACGARHASDVIVATDDPRIVAAVESFGGTRRDDPPRPRQRHRPRRRGRRSPRRRHPHQSARRRTSRRARLPRPARRPARPRSERRHGHASRAVALARSNGATPIASRWYATPPAGPSTSAAARSPSSATVAPTSTARPARFLQHLGLYAYRRSFLLQLAATPPAPLELMEKLEQLRVSGSGHANPGRVRRTCRARGRYPRRLRRVCRFISQSCKTPRRLTLPYCPSSAIVATGIGVFSFQFQFQQDGRPWNSC